jgi:ElaB/YqjD/DUF883 family membrane-anchored ribosome-binding protein
MKSRIKSPSVPKTKAGELIADIDELMAEAEEMLSESTSHHAEEKVALLRPGWDTPEQGILARVSAAKARLASIARQTEATVRQFPYESLIVALGIGVFLGARLRGGWRK